MTDKYLDSAAGGTGSGDDWTNAYTSYSSVALTGSGDRVFIANGHSDSSDNSIQGVSGGDGQGVMHISVDKTGSTPPVNADYTPGTKPVLTASGTDYSVLNTCSLYGVKLQGVRHTSINLGADELVTTYDCEFGHGSDDTWIFGGASARQIHYNTTLSSDTGGASDNAGGLSFGTGNGGVVIDFYGGTAGSNVEYKDYIVYSASVAHVVNLRGFDFSAYGTTGGVVGILNSSVNESEIRFYNCSFPHSATFGIGTSTLSGAGRLECIGCGLVDNTSQEQGLIHDQFGDMEVWGGGLTNRAVYRTASVAPPHQTNPLTWRCEITSNCSTEMGFRLWPLMRYYSTTGSTITITLHYLLGRDAGAVVALDDTQLDMMVEYYDNTGVLYTVEHTRSGPLNLGGETDHSSGASWTTTDVAETNNGAYSYAHTTSGTLAQEGFVRVTPIIHDLGTNDAIYFDTRLEIS